MTGRFSVPLRVAAVTASAAIVSAIAALPATAAEGDIKVVNTETVQVYTSPTGEVETKRIYEQLAVTGNGTVELQNPISTDGLRNLEEGFIPPIIDVSVLDKKIKVSTRQALATTRELLEKEAIFAGISSGAALAIAIRFAKDADVRNVVVLLPDGGWKYLSTGAYTGDFEEAATRLEGILWA